MSTSLDAWKASVVDRIFNVTLDAKVADQSNHSVVYLADLADELRQEQQGQDPPRTDPSIVDRVLIARLSMDPMGDSMTDDDVALAALANLDDDDTSWDCLIASWRRCQREYAPAKKQLGPVVAPQAVAALDEMSALIVSYAGLVLQTPDMFPRHKKGSRTLSPRVLVPSILSIAGVAPTSSGDPSQAFTTLDQTETPLFLSQLATRFYNDGLEDILEPAVAEITRRIREGALSIGEADEDEDDEHRGRDSSPAQPQQAGVAAPDQAALQAAAAAGNVRSVLTQLLGVGGGGHGGGGGADTGNRAQRLPAPSPGGFPQGMHIGGFDWRSHVTPIVDMCDNKEIAAALTSAHTFDPDDVPASQLEFEGLLGPVLRLSCFPDGAPKLVEEYFSNPSSRSRDEIASNIRSLEQTLSVVHGAHFRLFNSMVRAGPESKERVLRFWGRAADLNRRRGQMRARADEVASDGFMCNLFETLERFAEPFMDPSYSKIDRIDPEYHRYQKRFKVSSLTRLNASEAEAQKWVEEAPSAMQPPNFITEIFFLAQRMLCLGPAKAIRTCDERQERQNELKKRVKEVKESRETWQSTPQAPQYEAWIKKSEADIEAMKAANQAAHAQLLAPEFLERMIHFVSFTMTWLVRIADPRSEHPKRNVELPLPQTVPEHFRMLPEHIFEDVCNILLFIAHWKPLSLNEPSKKDFVTFSVTFLSSGWFIKNPFLKAKLAEVMWWNIIPYGDFKVGIMGDVINCHPLALQHLVPAMMSFWVEAENTGSHTQFYDKFRIRYNLSQIFQVIWNNPEHMARIQGEATGNSDGFVVFINRLMNDVTFLLDDALEKLVELHQKQQEMGAGAAWEERSAEERQEVTSHVHSLEGQVRSMLSFGNEFLRLLIDLTSVTQDAFVTPEIVSRLAAMLDFNLDVLVGPRCTELKVKDAKTVRFEPRTLLQQLLSVYLNLASRPEFVKAIAADGRSYRKENFAKARGIAARHMLKSALELEALDGMVDRVETVLAEEREEEEDLGELPDEYADPLMATLMREPVRLPSSGAVLDLSTIKSHLLSDATDPFNRMPLKLEECKPAAELKAEIEAWVRERKAAKAKERAAQGGAQ